MTRSALSRYLRLPPLVLVLALVRMDRLLLFRLLSAPRLRSHKGAPALTVLTCLALRLQSPELSLWPKPGDIPPATICNQTFDLPVVYYCLGPLHSTLYFEPLCYSYLYHLVSICFLYLFSSGGTV